MKGYFTVVCVLAAMLGLALADGARRTPAWADDGHAHAGAPVDEQQMLEQMKKMHGGHEHAHDFAAMEALSHQEMGRIMGLMMDIGLALPPMDSKRGCTLFVDKGCVVCHVVNGVGGEVGPSLDAADLPPTMNAFEFSARMWRGAPAMVQMQEDLMGGAISLTGEELADLVAFAHDEAEQKELTAAQIPERYRKLIEQ